MRRERRRWSQAGLTAAFLCVQVANAAETTPAQTPQAPSAPQKEAPSVPEAETRPTPSVPVPQTTQSGATAAGEPPPVREVAQPAEPASQPPPAPSGTAPSGTAPGGTAAAPTAPVRSSDTPPAPPPHLKREHPANRGFTALSYEMTMPVGVTYDYAGNFSGRGVSLEYRHLWSKQFSTGLRGAWHVVSDKVKGTEEFGAVTVNATQLRNVNVIPIQLTGHYYLAPVSEGVAPYVGGGLGVHWAERRTSYGLWVDSQDAWHAGLSPEVGILVPFSESQFSLSTRFTYLLPSGDKSDELYVNFCIGLAER